MYKEYMLSKVKIAYTGPKGKDSAGSCGMLGSVWGEVLKWVPSSARVWCRPELLYKTQCVIVQYIFQVWLAAHLYFK